jgi:hypothetical protein
MQRDWSGIEEWLGDLPDEVETITIRTGDVRSSLEAVGRVEAPVEVGAIRSALDDVGGGGRILRLDAYGAKGRHVRARERAAGSAVEPSQALAGLALPAGTDPLVALVIGVLQAQSLQSSALVDRVITSNERLVGMLGTPFTAMAEMFREMREEMRGERLGREQAEIDARALETLVEGALASDGAEGDPLRQAVAAAVERVAGAFTGGGAVDAGPGPEAAVDDGPGPEDEGGGAPTT